MNKLVEFTVTILFTIALFVVCVIIGLAIAGCSIEDTSIMFGLH
jgi:hypothetical protein